VSEIPKIILSITLPVTKSTVVSHREGTQTQETMKAISATSKAAALKARKDALERGERTPARVFRIEKKPDGTFSRVAVNPESQRRKSAKAWEAKSEVAKVRHSLGLTQEAFAGLLGIGLSTLRISTKPAIRSAHS